MVWIWYTPVLFKKKNKWTYQIHSALAVTYEKEWEEKLSSAFYASKEELIDLDILYGRYVASKINHFISSQDIKKTAIHFIASHGHTIFHKPEENYTLQIGCGQTIAKQTGLTVINNFRSNDVKMGGQGAPLVPIGDRDLFSDYDACLNLGGFSNISFEDKGKRLAFDICPVNILMNEYAQHLGVTYDNKGRIASTGKNIPELLKQLNSLDFYLKPAPKSLGKEWVEIFVKPILENPKHQNKDILRTLTEHISDQIANICKRYKFQEVLCTGGGVYNDYLIEKIKEKTSTKISIPSNSIIEFKEALIFGYLGVLKHLGLPNCLKSVTGASKDNTGGVIHSP